MLLPGKTSGIILLEIMLAMSLGLFLLGLLLSIYQTSQQSLTLQHALYQIQDRANVAITLLTTDIKQAGHIGCPRLSSQLSTPVISEKNKLSGTSNEITIRYTRLGPALVSAMRKNTELYASLVPRMVPGSMIIIADCEHAEAAKVARVTREKDRQHIMLQYPVQHLFGKLTEINTLISHHYFIKRTQRINPDGTPVYALFGNQNTELVEGITAIKFMYTVKQGKKLVDVEAKNISDWSQVLGVAIQLSLYGPSFKREAYAYAVLNTRAL